MNNILRNILHKTSPHILHIILRNILSTHLTQYLINTSYIKLHRISYATHFINTLSPHLTQQYDGHYQQTKHRYLIASLEKYFYYYVAINYIEGLSDWDTSRVENMNDCFAGCTPLAYHNIENRDVFDGCDNLSLVKCSKETFDELFNAYWWT